MTNYGNLSASSQIVPIIGTLIAMHLHIYLHSFVSLLCWLYTCLYITDRKRRQITSIKVKGKNILLLLRFSFPFRSTRAYTPIVIHLDRQNSSWLPEYIFPSAHFLPSLFPHSFLIFYDEEEEDWAARSWRTDRHTDTATVGIAASMYL